MGNIKQLRFNTKYEKSTLFVLSQLNFGLYISCSELWVSGGNEKLKAQAEIKTEH